jgi:uncharacterized protein YbjT (DUF2867 family)
MQIKNVENNVLVDHAAKHAIIVGATGATGKDLLELLLKDNSFYKVDVFVRRHIDIKHEKLTVHVIDFDKNEQWKHLVKGDVLFSCLGTTLKAAGSKAAQWKIDYDYQYQFAKAARENQVKNYVLVSSQGASAKSRVFYTKMKGQLEDAVIKLQFPLLSIFNPPILIRHNSDRLGEKIGVNIIKVFNKIGLLLSLKPLSTRMLAQAMIGAAKNNKSNIAFFKSKEIWQLVGEMGKEQ